MKLDVFSLIVLLGALQALFFGIFLFFTKATNTLQKRSLAIFILILSYNGFETLGWSTGWGWYAFMFNILPFVFIFGLGPGLYLYVRSFQTDQPVEKPHLHYIIVWLMCILHISIVLTWYIFPAQRMFLSNVDHWYVKIGEPLSMLWFCFYYVLSVRCYRQLMPANINNGTWVPEEAGIVMRWLRLLLIFLGIIAVAWFFTLLTPHLVDLHGVEPYYIIEVMLVIFIYWIGFAGYLRTRVIYIAQQQKTRSYYESLEALEVTNVLAALEKSMEQDKLYLDTDLTITSLAAKLDMPAKTISAILNQRLNKRFNEYVNAYRVKALQQKILDPSNHHLTIPGMAFECGFNSQPTFQRAFKTETGMTPREFQSKYASSGIE